MLKAVIYCRCSTEEESQKEALKNQVAEAKECIRQNGWLLVDAYIESKSGTTADKRKEYQRLYEDLHTGKFDIVQIKSQDRLMRNTKDWYLFVDRLIANDKKLYIYMEQKFYTPDDALITGIKAILAEEYSKELSKKINNAHRNRQKRGESFILPSNTYGYEKLPDKSMVIVEDEAKVIRLMFYLCRTMGCGRIASVLEQEGYRDRRGHFFQGEAIRRIIRNPIRCGTIVQNKRHFDFQLKQELKMPEEEWIVHKEAIPAIVNEQAWEEANHAMDRRIGTCHTGERVAGVKNGRFDLSGKIYCGLCGGKYYRSYRKRCKDQAKIMGWKCQNYLRYGRNGERKVRSEMRKSPKIPGKGCDNIHLDEQKLLGVLEELYETYFPDYGTDIKEIMDQAISVLKKVLHRKEPLEKSRELKQTIQRKELLIEKLMDKLLGGVISDGDYKRKREELDGKLGELKNELESCQPHKEAREEEEYRIHKMKKRLQEEILRKGILSELLDNIERIEVFEDRLKIYFFTEARLEAPSSVLELLLGDSFLYASRKEAERSKIIAYMKENPCITAKEIADMEKVSLSTANYRIKKLHQQGKIYFNGRGGHGEWEVCE